MKRLYRNKKEAKIAGICAGLGDYFEIDPVIVRLIFLLAFFLGGGLIVYIIAWVIIPAADYGLSIKCNSYTPIPSERIVDCGFILNS
ncbi:MAG: PspC domain-containing protein [Bacteroidota bacterium]